MKRVAKYIIDILTAFIFLILVLVIFSKVKMIVSGKDYFEIFGYSVFNVATGSMEPTISKNDIIIVKLSDDYKVDDIVTFKKDNSYITHRVIMVNNNNIVTKGDANNTNDVDIEKSAVLGKVTKIIHNAGIWQKTLTSPKVIIMIFVTLLLFDFSFSYSGFKKEAPKEKSNQGKIDIDKLSKEELKTIYDKINSVKTDKEIKNLEYTIGLDLSSIQEKIKNSLDKGEK